MQGVTEVHTYVSNRTSPSSRAHLLRDDEYLCEVFKIEFTTLSQRCAEVAGKGAHGAVVFSTDAAQAEPLRIHRQARYVLRLGDGRSLRVQPVACDAGREASTVTALVLGETTSSH